nr:MAG TPA: hypothetical protein [Caudoviricetes sp.]
MEVINITLWPFLRYQRLRFRCPLNAVVFRALAHTVEGLRVAGEYFSDGFDALVLCHPGHTPINMTTQPTMLAKAMSIYRASLRNSITSLRFISHLRKFGLYSPPKYIYSGFGAAFEIKQPTICAVFAFEKTFVVGENKISSVVGRLCYLCVNPVDVGHFCGFHFKISFQAAPRGGKYCLMSFASMQSASHTLYTSSSVHGVLSTILSLTCVRLNPHRRPRVVWSYPFSSISARSFRYVSIFFGIFLLHQPKPLYQINECYHCIRERCEFIRTVISPFLIGVCHRGQL